MVVSRLASRVPEAYDKGAGAGPERANSDGRTEGSGESAVLVEALMTLFSKFAMAVLICGL